MRFRRLCQSSLLVVSLSLAGMLFAQSSAGTITGTVVDPSGAAVAGVLVTARNLNTGLIQTTKTSTAGIYSMPNLPPGTYSIKASSHGFKTFTQSPVQIDVASTTTLNIRLEIGAVTQSVTIKGGAPLLKTSTSEHGTVVNNHLIDNLPLEVSGTIRNPIQFITLVPGFVGSVSNNPASNNSDDFKLNGGQETGTDILVNGVSISLVSPNTQMNIGVSPAAVAQFKTLQSNFSARYGQSGDGIISLTLKSGTNHFHGSVYDFLRNRALDANSWTNNVIGAPKSANTQNDFGFLVSGPVVIPKVYNGHNRTFFMYDYEGFRFHTGGTSISSFPNENFRNGNFGALCSSYNASGFCTPASGSTGTQLYDPTTQQPIPFNNLHNDPNFTESSVMQKAFSYMPPTNGSLTANTFAFTSSQTTANLWDLELNHSISNRQRISGGLDWDNTNTGSVVSLGPIFGGQTPQNTRYARFSYDFIFSPTVLNHFLMGYSRRFRGELSNGIGDNFPQKLGLTGVQNTTFPCIFFTGTPYSQVLNNCGDSQFADNVFQMDDSLNWIHGKNSFVFGAGFRDMEFNVRRLTQSSGQFNFNSPETSSPVCDTSAFTAAHPGVSCGNAVASALFGLVNQATLNYGSFSGVRYKAYDFYAQDNYKATPRLTLNLGLRYDLPIPASEAFNRFSMVDPLLQNPQAGNLLGAYTYFGTGPGRNGRKRPQSIFTSAFGPRIGFAYELNNKTVIRSGYGIYYEPVKENSYADQDGLGFFNKENITTANVAPFQIDNGMPHIIPPTGPLTPGGQNGNSGVIMVPSTSGQPGDMQSWNFDVQRQISRNTMVSVAYVGSKGTHLPALNVIPNQVNPAYLPLGSELGMNISCVTNGTCPQAVAMGAHVPYPGFTGTVAQSLRPFPQYGDFNQEDNSFTPDKTGNSTYHSMQVKLTKEFSQGLTFLVGYTVSKDITSSDSMGPGVQGFIGANAYIGQNSYNRRAEKAVSELDTPQTLVTSFFYKLPIGNGERFLSHTGIASHLVSGWDVAGILTYHSGTPMAVYEPCGSNTAGYVLFAGCEFTGMARVNLIPGVPETNKSSQFQPANTPFYNPAAFQIPAPYTFGNEGRALPHARTFASKNEDFTLEKTTNLVGDKVKLNFRAEFFNLFNRHIYTAPDGFSAPITTPFEPVGSSGCPGPFACGFGAVTSSSGPRTIQFGLKITY